MTMFNIGLARKNLVGQPPKIKTDANLAMAAINKKE